MKFLKTNSKMQRLGMLLINIWETCTTDQMHETGRLKHTHAEENVISVDKNGKLTKPPKARNKHTV